MAVSTLAATSTWFTQGGTTVKRDSITEIEIKSAYTPDSSVTIVSSWDASEDKDSSVMCYVIGTKLIIAGNGVLYANINSESCFSDVNSKDYFSNVVNIINLDMLNTQKATSMRFMFDNCSKLSTLNLNSLNTSNVETMYGLCLNCSSLRTIDLRGLNTSKVTNMVGSFYGCSTLEEAYLSGINTSSLKTITQMFYNCKKLHTTDIQNLDVSNVNEMGATFSNCSSLESLDLNAWDTKNVTYMRSLFSGCSSLKNLKVSNWDTSNVKDMNYLFSKCSSLKTIDVSSWNTSNVTRMYGTFSENTSLENIDVSLWDVRNVETTCGMFANCGKLAILNLSNWIFTDKMTDTNAMFYGCSELVSIGDVSNWDFSNNVYPAQMFCGCKKLKDVDVSKWNISNACQYLEFMFYECSSLKEIDVSGWDVSGTVSFDHFAAHANLKRKGIENWKTTSATNMNALFHNCAEEELDLSGWDVSKVQFFCQMFENSPNLKRIKGLDKWDTSAGLGFDGMFERCYKLEEVDLSAFNTSKAKNGAAASGNGHKTATMNNMFLSCNNLKKIKLGSNFSINGDGTNTTAANKLILPTPSTDYIAGADGNWYAFNGDPYAPNAIPDRTADIYFASFPLCQDQDVIVKNGSMIDTAKAIREKNGTTTKYNPSQFGEAIRALN